MATKTDLLKFIRLFCAECMGGPRATEMVWPIKNIAEVASCTAPECIWFDYRFGKDPNPNPKKVEAGRKRMLELRQK